LTAPGTIITGSRTHAKTSNALRVKPSPRRTSLLASHLSVIYRRRFEQSAANSKNRAKNWFKAQNLVKFGPFHSAGISSCVYTAIRYTGRPGVFPNRFEQTTRRSRRSPSKIRKTLVSHFSARRVGANPRLVIDLNIIRGRIPVL
jgi:hypothetical protein